MSADLSKVILGIVILVSVATAILLYRWQTGLRGQAITFLKQAQEARGSGRLEAAERACLQAARCARLNWLHRGDALAVALYDLAVVYYQQGKLAQAEQAAVTAFNAARRFGRGSSVTPALYCLTAQIYKTLGKDLLAGPFFEVSIPLLRKRFGSRSLKVGAALHELGVTLTRVGLPEKAMEALTECVPILTEHFGKDHGDVAAALTNLGKAQSLAGHYADAEQTYRRAITIREGALGPDDPEVALLLNNLAVTYKKQERIPEALDCLRRSLAIREAKLGPNHHTVGLVLNNLANCLRLQRQYDDAETVLTRAKAILGNPQHQAYATVLDSLASLRAAQGRYAEADSLYQECFKVHKSRPSSSLLELAESCERYADVLYKLQREKQADALMAQVGELRATREKLLTPSVGAA